MGTARYRERELSLSLPGGYESGYYTGSPPTWTSTGFTTGSSLANSRETCSDTIEPPPFEEPHSLQIIKRRVNPLRYYGEARLSSVNYRRHTGYNPTSWTGHAYVSDSPPTDWNYWKAKAMAAVNPFNPQVDLPLFLFELREFPRMLRDLGRVLSGGARPRDVPGGYLAYNFGWAPLVSDLGSLIDLGDAISKQRRYLTDASEGRRVKRRLGSLNSGSSLSNVTYALGTSGTYSLAARSETTIRAWTTARIHLNEPLPTMPQELNWLALRAAFGLNINPSTLWDAMPWSWLIDYFTNIGDIVEARNGFHRWKFTEMFVMVTTSRVDRCTHALNQVGSMSFTGGIKSYVRKERSYVGANPTLGFGLSPVLSGYQMSILGALVTAGALKSRR